MMENDESTNFSIAGSVRIVAGASSRLAVWFSPLVLEEPENKKEPSRDLVVPMLYRNPDCS